MGRKMLRMERIANEKTRFTTYKKRKACLLKKANEFSTLCGVDACLIIYGPKRTEEEEAVEPETWPTDENKVHDIISKYRDTSSSSCRKTSQIHDFLSERANNMEKRIKYRTWDEKLGECSQEELCRILGDVDDKIHRAQRFVSHLEEAKRQSWALAEISRSANQQTLCGYNNIEQQNEQQLVPWSPLGHFGFPFSRPHDQMSLEPVKALMMLRRPFPGFYGGPGCQYGSVPLQGSAYFEPQWTQENIVINGIDQFTSSLVQRSTT